MTPPRNPRPRRPPQPLPRGLVALSNTRLILVATRLGLGTRVPTSEGRSSRLAFTPAEVKAIRAEYERMVARGEQITFTERAPSGAEEKAREYARDVLMPEYANREWCLARARAAFGLCADPGPCPTPVRRTWARAVRDGWATRRME